MFYSTEVLSVKSKSSLSVVWLAGCGEQRRLISAKLGVQSVDIRETCAYLLDPPEPLSLRLQAMLLVGVCRIYGMQYGQFTGQVEGVWKDLVMSAPPQPEKARRRSSLEHLPKKRLSLDLLDEAIHVDDALLSPEHLRRKLSNLSTGKSSELVRESSQQEAFNDNLLDEFEDVLKSFSRDSSKPSTASSLHRPDLDSEPTVEPIRKRAKLEPIIFDAETTIELCNSLALSIDGNPVKKVRVNLAMILDMPLMPELTSSIKSSSSTPIKAATTATTTSFVEYEVPTKADLSDPFNVDISQFNDNDNEESLPKNFPWSRIDSDDSVDKFLRYVAAEAYPQKTRSLQSMGLDRQSAIEAFTSLLLGVNCGRVHVDQSAFFGSIEIVLE